MQQADDKIFASPNVREHHPQLGAEGHKLSHKRDSNRRTWLVTKVAFVLCATVHVFRGVHTGDMAVHHNQFANYLTTEGDNERQVKGNNVPPPSCPSSHQCAKSSARHIVERKYHGTMDGTGQHIPSGFVCHFLGSSVPPVTVPTVHICQTCRPVRLNWGNGRYPVHPVHVFFSG